jgi:hypothetical protein
VALVRTDVSEECIVSIIRLKRIRVLETTFVFLRSVLQLLVTANIVPSSLILFTPMMEAIRASESSAIKRATRRRIPEEGIFHSHFRENIKSFSEICCFQIKLDRCYDLCYGNDNNIRNNDAEIIV